MDFDYIIEPNAVKMRKFHGFEIYFIVLYFDELSRWWGVGTDTDADLMPFRSIGKWCVIYLKWLYIHTYIFLLCSFSGKTWIASIRGAFKRTDKPCVCGGHSRGNGSRKTASKCVSYGPSLRHWPPVAVSTPLCPQARLPRRPSASPARPLR